MIYQIISAVDFVMKHSIFYSILYLVLYKFIQSLPKYGVVGLEFTRLLETRSGKIAPFFRTNRCIVVCLFFCTNEWIAPCAVR